MSKLKRGRVLKPGERGRICQQDGCEREAALALIERKQRQGHEFAVWRLWCDAHGPGAEGA